MEIKFDKDGYYKQIGESYFEAIEDLEKLKELDQKGWDSYDADPIDPIAVEQAKIIVGYVIYRSCGHNFAIFPLHFNGGVVFQIEFEIGEEDREPSYFDCSTPLVEEVSKLLTIEVYRDGITLYLYDYITEKGKLNKVVKIKNLIEIKNYLDEVFK